ncbi:MAG: hypothetical protein IKV90_10835 [Clostridia bacterium]|nr:hypothetical protein [Clostridia bacterium]
MGSKKRTVLVSGVFALVVALSGCSLQSVPAASPTPDAAAKATAQPETSSTPEQSGEEGLPLSVGGEELRTAALEEAGKLLLPLKQTAEVLGWAAEEESAEEETQTKRSVVLSKGDSRITVSWVVSDNTAKSITWQKDGLLIPVNTQITTKDGVIYVPAAFFEEATGVRVSRTQDGVSVALPEEKSTPEADAQSGQSSDE